MFFISSAFADGASAAQSGGIMSFLPMIAFIAILYFLLIRPQQKRQKQHQALISSIKKGDKVVTNSGIIATVSKVVNDHEVILEIANGVHCKFVKSAISSVFNETAQTSTPASAKSEEKSEVTGTSPIKTEKPAQNSSKVVQLENVSKPHSKPQTKKAAPKKTSTPKK